MLPSLLHLAEVRRLVGIGKSQLYRLIAVGDFPAPVKIRRSSRWLSSEVDAWIHAQAGLRASEPMGSGAGARQEAHFQPASSRPEVLK
jgi:prophage regulatory protein